nr:hypothetical protein CFP56_02528 [Quercus suber]
MRSFEERSGDHCFRRAGEKRGESRLAGGLGRMRSGQRRGFRVRTAASFSVREPTKRLTWRDQATLPVVQRKSNREGGVSRCEVAISIEHQSLVRSRGVGRQPAQQQQQHNPEALRPHQPAIEHSRTASETLPSTEQFCVDGRGPSASGPPMRRPSTGCVNGPGWQASARWRTAHDHGTGTGS